MLTKLNALREAREEGFTLIELLVVILIIGILAAIAIPVFLNQRKTSNDAAVESDVKNAATAVETWTVSQKGSNIPVDLATLAASGNEVKTSEGVTLSITGTNTTGYCIVGYHENGKNYTSTSAAATYDSVSGGLGRDGGACVGGINNEEGTVETPAAMAFAFTGPSGENEQIDITAAYNSYGSVTVSFLGADSVSGSLDLTTQLYCGTTPAQFGEGSVGGYFGGGMASGDLMYVPNAEESGCGAVDGISLVSNPWNADYSDWDLTADTGIIPIAGTAPAAPAPSETPTEPAPNEYPTTSIAGGGSESGNLYSQNMETGAYEATATTWTMTYEADADGNITYNLTFSDTTINSNFSTTLNDGGYGSPYHINVDGAIVNGVATGTFHPGHAVDGPSLTHLGDYSTIFMNGTDNRLEYSNTTGGA